MISVNPLFDFQFRLILVGDSTVGKSSLVRAFTDRCYSGICDPTVGVDFLSHVVQLSNGARVKLQLWDTAGQEKFHSITQSYYRNSVAALLVFDIGRRASFEHLFDWFEEARLNMHCPKPCFIIIGQKADMDESRQVTKREAEHFAQGLGLEYFETSALTGQHVEACFTRVAELVHSQLLSGHYNASQESTDWDGVKHGYGAFTHNTPSINVENYDSSSAGSKGKFCCT